MMRNDEHFLYGAIPAEIAENLNEFFPEFGDLNYEEVLQHQESVYRSLKGTDRNTEKRSYYGQSSNGSQFSGKQCESSRRESFDSELALDEALARSLQELEDNFGDLNISQAASNATGRHKEGQINGNDGGRCKGDLKNERCVRDEGRAVESRAVPGGAMSFLLGGRTKRTSLVEYGSLCLRTEGLASLVRPLESFLITNCPRVRPWGYIMGTRMVLCLKSTAPCCALH